MPRGSDAIPRGSPPRDPRAAHVRCAQCRCGFWTVGDSHEAALLFWLTGCLLLAGGPACAQYAAVVQSCSPNVKQLCNDPATRRFADCIALRYEAFAEPCKAALADIAAVRSACASDIRQQCGTVTPGGGAVLLCVKDRYSALGAACKSEIARAAARKMRVR